MKPLALDYLNANPRRHFAAYVLAAVALGYALDVGLRHVRLKTELKELETQVAARTAVSGERRGIGTPQPVSAEEYESARDTAKRLTTPWVRLFGALEAAQTDRVALLSVTPDAERRTVSILGEARDYLAALSYVANLGEQKSLRSVRLSRHEIRPGSAKSVAFTVSAAWKDEE